MSAITFPHVDLRNVTTDKIVAECSKTALSVVAGAVAGFALTMVPFIGGALFSATSAFSFPYIESALHKIAPDSQTTALKVGIKVAAMLASMCFGGLALSLVGIPVSVLGMITMTAAIHL